ATIDHREAEEGVTALHVAVIACRSTSTACLKNVEMLLAAGADVNVADCDGWTPRHSCAYYNLPQLVPMLLRAGADPARVAHSGLTSAEMALEKGHDAVARLLR
ncbi:MAG: ankyrin repeat domain-containing protein, partial [Akkermansia sp.]|nr:ankyrin repeat domain-containing protein [Akkermansia sp.]